MCFGVVKIDLSSFSWYLCLLSACRRALLPMCPGAAIPLRPAPSRSSWAVPVAPSGMAVGGEGTGCSS